MKKSSPTPQLNIRNSLKNRVFKKNTLAVSLWLLFGTTAMLGSNVVLADSQLKLLNLNEEDFASGSTVCAVFNDEMENSPQLGDLKAYLQVQARNGHELEGLIPFARNNSICISGLKGGDEYHLNFKKGLRSSNGFELTQNSSQSIVLSDLKAHLSIERGVLLPKSISDSTVYVNSVNIKEIKAELFRIEKNALIASEYADRLSGDNLHSWESWPLLHDHAKKLAEIILSPLGTPNESIATPIDLATLCGKTPDDGVYLLSIKDNSLTQEDENAPDFQDRSLIRLIVVSDLGVTAFRSERSVKIAVRSLRSANPVPGAEFKLFSRGSFELYSGRTDADGFATIPYEALKGKEASRPAAIAVTHGSDFLLLPLEGQAEISLQALTGQEDQGLPFKTPTDLKVMGFTDRGIARPGETLHFTALVRNHALKAAALDALIFKIRRPDGATMLTKTLNAQGSGFFADDFSIPEQGPLGTWFLECYLGDKLLSQNTVLISEYSPQELTIQGDHELKNLFAGDEAKISLQANYNYGAVASGLSADASLFASPESHPFKTGELASFSFGPAQIDDAQKIWQQELPAIILGADGHGVFSLQLPHFAHAQKLNFNSRIYTDGNTASFSTQYLIKPHHALIGLKQSNDGIEVACVDSDGKALDTKVRYSLYKLIRDYQYVLDSGSWKFVAKTRRYLSRTAEFEAQQGLSKLALQDLSDGEYLLDVNASGGNSSLIFTKGYSLANDASLRPDRFEVTCDKDHYLPQDKIKLTFISPDDGTADVLLGSDDIVQAQRFDVKKGENSVILKAEETFGAGVHALVSISTPAKSTPSAVRSFGLAFIRMDSTAHKLPLKLEVADEARPGQKLKATLEVPQSHQGKLHYTASLVDEGILQLTNHQIPDPFAFFTAPPKYAVRVSDLAPKLLHAFGENGQGYGFDEMLLKSGLSPTALTMLNQRSVILHHGVTEVNDGKANIEFEVPEFQGALRLNLIVADDEALGSLEKTIQIHSEAVPSLPLPAMMHRGDETELAFSVHNLELDPQDFKLSLQCSGSLQCKIDQAQSLKIPKGERASLPFKVKAVNAGEGSIAYTIKNGQFEKSATIKTEVLPATPPVFLQRASLVKAKESTKLTPAIPLEKIEHAQLSIGDLPYLDKKSLIQALELCPPISLQDKVLVLQAYLACPRDPKIDAKIKELASELLAYTDASAFFEEGDDYAQILACGTLLQAYKAKFFISPDFISGLRARLSYAASYSMEPTKALALENQAALGELNLSQLRYSYEQAKKNELPPLAAASYSKAFSLTGDSAHAKEALQLSMQGLKNLNNLNAEVNKAQGQEALLQALSKRNAFESASLSSEKFDRAWVLEATVMEGSQDEALGLNLKDLGNELWDSALTAQLLKSAVAYPKTTVFEPKVLNDGSFEVQNQDSDPVWATLSLLAYPKDNLNSSGTIKIQGSFINKDGSPLKTERTLVAHEDVVLLLTLDRTACGNAELVIRGSLPTGMSLNRALDEQRDRQTFGELITPKNVLSVGGNFILTLDGNHVQNLKKIRLGLSLRADLKGNLILPALQVFDPSSSGLSLGVLGKSITVK